MTGPGEPGQSTALVLLGGLGWGFIVTTFESLGQPPLELGLADYLTFYSRVLVHYCAAGLLLAWLTSRIGRLRNGFARRVAAVPALAAAMGLALLIDQLSLYVPLWRGDPMAAMAPRLSDLAAHMAWIFAVYGGLYMAVVFLLRREALSRESLRIAELARLQAELNIERATAQNRPVVAPDLLVRALSELSRRYSEDHRRADRLLDTLVRLLRSASGAGVESDSGREAALARGLGQLSRELGMPGGALTNETLSMAGG